MKVLKIEIIKGGIVVGKKQTSYEDEKGFLAAIVNACDELGIDIPVWTTSEERFLDKNGAVTIQYENGESLRITREVGL